MQSSVLLALGNYRFSVSDGAFQTFKRATSWRWPAQERIGMAPAKQFVGPGECTVSIEGVIYPHYAGGLRQIDQMIAQAGLGSPLQLVTGYGRYLGLYCIEKVTDDQSVFMQDGAPKKIEFTIELGAYG
jgi:phage protein U